LLFPTDFSQISIRALHETLQLNTYLNYEIIVFHAYSRPMTKKSGEGSLIAKKRRITEKFEKLLDEVPDLRNHKHTFKMGLGYSTDMILSEVAEHQIKLIIMGTKGAVGVGELFGTKTHEIVEKINEPIIIVPKEGSLADIKRIGLACDFSKPTNFGKLDFLIQLSELLQAEVHIITMNRDDKTMSDTEKSNREKVHAKMDKLKAQFTQTYHESVEHGLIDYCKKNEIDLLGILPKNYNFMEKIFHESLTRRMAFQSPVPLLILK